MKLLLPLVGAILLIVLLLKTARVPIRYNLRNLVVRWRVTVLTALAFTLVIALLTVMLAFVEGMYRLTEGSGQPGNVLVLADGATDEMFSNLGYRDTNDIEYCPEARKHVLRDEHDQPLCSREVYMVVNQPVPIQPGQRPRRRFLQVRGIDDPVMSARVHGLELYPGGKWFSTAGVEKLSEQAGTAAPSPGKESAGTAASTKPAGGAPDTTSAGITRSQAIQVVLGEGIARELGHDQGKERLDVGDRFNAGNRWWVVMGVMQSMGSTYGSEIWAKRSIVGPVFGKENYTSIVLRAAGAPEAAFLAKDLTKNFKKSAVQCQPETEYYAKLAATNKQFLYAIVFVAVIMAVGGIFGVMNTMFAAISQRTRDIGVLRIIGFSPWQILVSFFVESLWIALAGGLLGLALGYVADGWTATSILSSGQGGGKSVVFKLIIDGNIMGTGLIVTLLMGGIGGLLPSLTAMRLKPLDALR